jgi:hypothetical protein
MEIIADITTCNRHVTKTSDEVTYVIHLLSLPGQLALVEQELHTLTKHLSWSIVKYKYLHITIYRSKVKYKYLYITIDRSKVKYRYLQITIDRSNVKFDL